MARIIVRALYGENFTATTTAYFTDVPVADPDFRYIQKIRDLGVTTGCGTTNTVQPPPLHAEKWRCS
jgi:hypothetical protein